MELFFFLCLNATNRVNSNYIQIENISQQLGYLYSMTSNYYGFEQCKVYFDTKYQKAQFLNELKTKPVLLFKNLIYPNQTKIFKSVLV